MFFGGPSGIRTRVAALKGQSPKPLDDGANWITCELYDILDFKARFFFMNEQ